ncbi:MULTISPECIES: hypothetical protein [unclassified Devosia]|uniref:hypothetical protein n=1 Tax=unclassified Devosia TaxID=196773 RepID=UPI0015532898|nr:MULTISPECIES: hypothetical protein [unclassified Devosia]
MKAINKPLPAIACVLVLMGSTLGSAFGDKLSNSLEPAPSAGTAADTGAIDWGDDAGEWANDGECDDPRFEGQGVAVELLEADRLHDATDCRTAFEAGRITLRQGNAANPPAAPDFGDNTSQWANDHECDDPRFEGAGVADELLEVDRMHDAADCRAAFEAGTITLRDPNAPPPVTQFDYGSDTSRWANDGECDDPRFRGEGTSKKLLSEDIQADATDCRTLESEGKVAIRAVYQPSYQAGAPYPTEGIDFGDNTSEYANDDECDDPRFEGPGAALNRFEEHAMHDSADCKAAFEAGSVALVEPN